MILHDQLQAFSSAVIVMQLCSAGYSEYHFCFLLLNANKTGPAGADSTGDSICGIHGKAAGPYLMAGGTDTLTMMKLGEAVHWLNSVRNMPD